MIRTEWAGWGGNICLLKAIYDRKFEITSVDLLHRLVQWEILNDIMHQWNRWEYWGGNTFSLALQESWKRQRQLLIQQVDTLFYQNFYLQNYQISPELFQRCFIPPPPMPQIVNYFRFYTTHKISHPDKILLFCKPHQFLKCFVTEPLTYASVKRHRFVRHVPPNSLCSIIQGVWRQMFTPRV